MTVEVKVYDGVKYYEESQVINETQYEIEGFEVISDQTHPQQVYEIESQGLIDACHEYLILYVVGGETATYRNSNADLFKVY